MVSVIPFEYLSSGSLCSARLGAFWGCRLATSITWLKRGSRLLAGLVGGLMSHSAPSAWSVSSRCGVMVVAMGRSSIVSCPGTGGGRGEVVLCISSMRFTLEVLDLVFLVGAGDGEMGGEGESSLAITGIGKVGSTVALLVLRVEGGGGTFHVCGMGGVAPYSSTRESVSLSCSVSGWVLAWRWFFRGDLTGSASFVSFGLVRGGHGYRVHDVGGGLTGPVWWVWFVCCFILFAGRGDVFVMRYGVWFSAVPYCVRRARFCPSVLLISVLFVGWEGFPGSLWDVWCVVLCSLSFRWAWDAEWLVAISLCLSLCYSCFSHHWSCCLYCLVCAVCGLLCVRSVGYMRDIFTCRLRLSLPWFQPWENRAWWWLRFKEPPARVLDNYFALVHPSTQ